MEPEGFEVFHLVLDEGKSWIEQVARYRPDILLLDESALPSEQRNGQLLKTIVDYKTHPNLTNSSLLMYGNTVYSSEDLFSVRRSRSGANDCPC